jgi:hypothetical protein
MKVNIIRDEHGKVIATYEPPAPGGPQLKALLKPKHTEHQVDAPDSYRDNIKAFYKQHSK